jgi:hypothetical protein
LSLGLLSFTAVAALCAVLLTAKPASAVLIEYEVFFSDPRISGTITFESDDFSPNATNVIAVDFLFTDTVTGGIWNQGDAHVLGSPFQAKIDAAGTAVEFLGGVEDDTTLPGGTGSRLQWGFGAAIPNDGFKIDEVLIGTYSLTVVPEPSTALLLGGGLLGLAVRGRRRKA